MATLVEEISLETLVKGMREHISIEMEYAIDELIEEKGGELVAGIRRRLRKKVGEISMELAKSIQIESHQDKLVLTVEFREPPK